MKLFKGASSGDGNEEDPSASAITPQHHNTAIEQHIPHIHTCNNKPPVNPTLIGIKYVIFPENKFAQYWDFIVIMAIWYYAFYIPFHFGCSGGYYTMTNTGFMVFNMIVNMTFLVDTFLAFFRAYRDANGRLVYSLKSIRRNYIRSGWFFVNILASIPSSGFIYAESNSDSNREETEENAETDSLNLFFLLELFKLLRLLRIKKVMQRSEVMRGLWEIVPIEGALCIKFICMLTTISHWIACIWGLIAYLEAGSYTEDAMLNNLNWIGNWYNDNYVEGGLNPIGWSNSIPRYFLCLFWAIQSITSIGYGNIVPVTNIEYGFANALMLLCGIFWAYVIGALVDVVQKMGNINQEYIDRMQEANEMVKDFTTKNLVRMICSNAPCQLRIILSNNTSYTLHTAIIQCISILI